jgi:lipopolysaccharide biosynthesis regulator YciM
MKRALAILLGLATVCLVAYLSWLNPVEVEFRLTPTHTMPGHLGPLMVFAFLTGAVAVLIVVSVQAGRRAFVAWRSRRRQRRSERIDEWEERGEQLVWAGDPQRGRALLQKAWQRRPHNAHAVIALAASYRDTGELHRARGLLFDAANQYHTDPDILFALAAAYRAAGERSPCIEVLERLRALHPHAPRVLRALRDAYVDAQRWQEAAALQETLIGELRDIQQATREREYLAVLHYQASLTLTEPAARIQALENLADSRAGSLPILVSLGDALLAGGRADEASVLWERTLRSTPRTVLVERLAAIATEPRHRDRLRTLLRKLRADQIDANHVHLLTAQLHLADGNTDAAARELEALQNRTPAPGLLHHLWGEVHRHRGQLDQALNAYARANGASRTYQCTACQRTSAEWVGYCPNCNQWDSYRATVEISAG